MIIEEIRKIKSTKKDLRTFGLSVSAAMCLLGTLAHWHGKSYDWCFGLVSLFFLCAALIFPLMLKPIQKVWMSVAIVIKNILTGFVLVFLFYFAVTPVAFVARLFKRRFLELDFNQKKDSYWVTRPVSQKDKTDYENQY
ncbi:MAG: hypothetical protein Q8Q33_01525 [Chlamydiota bacterium]|nr:hypothetical protein [Chlamydiota bacterium]